MWTSLSLIIAFFCTYKPYIVNLYIKLFPLTCNLLCNICIFLLTFIIIITIIEMNECIFFVLCCKCSSIHMFVWLVVKSCNVMYWLSVIMYQFLYIYTQFTYKNCAFLFGINKQAPHAIHTSYTHAYTIQSISFWHSKKERYFNKANNRRMLYLINDLTFYVIYMR